jgi:hypothetical protein
MKNLVFNFRFVMASFVICIIFAVIGLLWFSESTTNAEKLLATNQENSANTTNNEIYLNRIENIRSEYAKIKSVEMESTVAIDLYNGENTIKGNGKIRYIAQGNKYKYQVSISENLEKAGLVRNLDIAYDGNRYFLLDHQARTLSFQTQEETRLPIAIPNPFLLPLDFLGRDDDSCINCKLRLIDVRNPTSWVARSNNIREIISEVNEIGVHKLMSVDGGIIQGIPFDYRVSFLGESTSSMEISSIRRTQKDNSILTDTIFHNYKNYQNYVVRFPYEITLASYAENRRPQALAKFTIDRLVLDDEFKPQAFTISYDEAEKVWDSDAKVFVKD